jgi:hypothetical protein
MLGKSSANAHRPPRTIRGVGEAVKAEQTPFKVALG